MANAITKLITLLHGELVGTDEFGNKYYQHRKQPKGHGTGAYLVGDGNLPQGTRVCMVEDTTTTGGSLLQAIERAQAAGLQVVQCLTVVDREEGAAKALAQAGYTLQALTTRSELLG